MRVYNVFSRATRSRLQFDPHVDRHLEPAHGAAPGIGRVSYVRFTADYRG